MATWSRELVLAVGAYALCSSSMLFFNKLSVSLTPEFGHRLLPGPISCMQLVFAIVFCFSLHKSKRADLSEAFHPTALKYYGLYGILFVGSVYSSMKSLQHSNMETQIVFRSASPLTVCVLDYVFLGRELPQRKSVAALAVVTVGALWYVATDAEFRMNGLGAYAWVSLYYTLICMEMTLGKMILSAVKLKNVWGSVLLTNGLSFPLLLILTDARGEFDGVGLAVSETRPRQWLVILAGCLTGTLIGWTGWNARGMVSATSYTLIGVANKFFTVLLSVAFLDKHASAQGVAALCLCIAASTQYEQAPLRKDARQNLMVNQADDETVAAQVRAMGSSFEKLPAADGTDEEVEGGDVTDPLVTRSGRPPPS